MGTVTDPKSDYNKDWLKKWLRGQPHIILGGDDPYLLRWYVIPRNTKFNIYLHKFCRSDDDRALHDHPWDFWSLILKGAYTEHTADGTTRRPWLSLAHRKAEHAHRVELDPWPDHESPNVARLVSDADYSKVIAGAPFEVPAWTLFFTTAKRREWGFHCPKGWMHWEKFTSGPHGEKSLGCGEFS